MKVLVTDGAGFIGSHVVDRLVRSGHDVVVLDNLTEKVHDGFPAYRNDRATYIWGDIRNRMLLRNLLEKVTVVNHQTGLVGANRSLPEARRYVEANSVGTATIIDEIINNDEVEIVSVAPLLEGGSVSAHEVVWGTHRDRFSSAASRGVCTPVSGGTPNLETLGDVRRLFVTCSVNIPLECA